MTWAEEIDLMGELGARALEQARAEREWRVWVGGEHDNVCG